MDSLPLEAPFASEVLVSETDLYVSEPPKIAKDVIRTSLKASNLDAFFTGAFLITTSGILLSNFLVRLGASPVVFGLLSSIPMLVNCMQPVGAYLSERTASRFQYSLRIFVPARLMWLILVFGIVSFSWGWLDSHQLIELTLLVVLISNLAGAFGAASWLSWMATLVPRQLRGRYFGLRNSVTSLTMMICVPLAGLAVSTWPGGTLQGYAFILFLGVITGLLSIGCQYFQKDVNPQIQNAKDNEFSPQTKNLNNTQINSDSIEKQIETPLLSDASAKDSLWKNFNFLMFLLYFSLWMFAVNLSLPFFNLYMLEVLNLDVSLVTLYGSFQAGANLIMLIVWGKLADKIGNRPILQVIGIVASSVPLLWLGIGTNSIDLWLWLPLIHIFIGGNWAALDLCNNNLQIDVASVKNQSVYFATAAAIAGVSGALGTTIGGFVAENPSSGGLAGLFVISAAFRVAAIIPLFFIHESRGQSLVQMIQAFWQSEKVAES
ncbi:MAG: MFS transporter [Rhizonema sp. PD37]|nr:MFS transporter [Rhizonema sp. PD37]